MNSIIVKGKIASDISMHSTQVGLAKAGFILETNNADPIPLKLYCLMSGDNAEKVRSLKKETIILVTGRLVASIKAGGKTGIALIASYYEVIT